MKILSLILRIVAILAAAAATYFYFDGKGKLADKHEKLTNTQAELSSTQNELSETSDKLKTTENQLKRESETLTKTKRTLETTQSELFASQQSASRNETALTSLRSQFAELQNTERELRADKVDLERQLAAASKEAEINQLNARIASLEERNAELEVELESAKVIVDAVNSKKNQAGPSIGGINTQLTSVDGQPVQRIKLETTVNSISTADGLIVLNSTPELGLAEGQTIILVQDLKSVGKVQIQSVTDIYAVANILPGTMKGTQLSSGSTVQLLL